MPCERGLTFGFVHEVKHVSFVSSFESANVVVFCAFEDLGETGEVDAERHWTIAAVSFESGRRKFHGDERDVRIVHRLENDTLLVALKIRVGYEFFDGWEQS
jgi:hypothetical protein